MEKNNKDNNKKEETKKPVLKNEMSEEDKEYKKNIDDMVLGLYDTDKDIRLNAFNMIKTEVTGATTSMTSIPKPLKFLRSHYEPIKDYYNQFSGDQEFKDLLSDLLAILATVTNDKSLTWILLGNKKSLKSWGTEFVKNLAGEIGEEYINRLDAEQGFDDLINLVQIIIPYLIANYSENEAVDLALEVEKLDILMEFVNENNYKRICTYLKASSLYAADTDEMKAILEIVYNIYLKYKEYPNALRMAIKMNNRLFIEQTFFNCEDDKIKKQMAFILGRQKIYLQKDDMPSELLNIISNLKISEYYKRLGRELNVLEPKHPEEVFKSHLEEKKSNDAKLDSYKINMATSIASSFINAGFGTESLLSKKDNDWLNRNKDEGVMSLFAGLGMVNMWDIELGPNELEKYMSNNEMDPHKRGGYNIGLGIISSGIRDENFIAYGILCDQLKDKNLTVKISALFGLALAYAGSQNDDLNEPFLNVLEDFSFGFEVSAFTSLSFGLVYLGSGNDEVIGNLISILIARNDSGKGKLMESPYLVLYVLGMGLTLFGMQKDADLMIEATQLDEFPADMKLYLKTLLTACAYAGSGNVTKVQEMQHIIAKSKDEVNPKVQSLAVISVSLIAIGEEVGTEMVLRAFNHFLQYGDNNVKRAIPLAMSLINLSSPKVTITESLVKFCYDTNKETAMNGIFGLGLTSSGTNHSRVSGQMRQLAAYYSEDTNLLLIVRIAQGLLHMGKGLLTLNPIHSNNFLVNNVALAGLLVTILSFTEVESLICGKHQFLIYSLCLAMSPKMAMLVNEDLEPKSVQVLVGTAVDTVGQSGNPRTITGFQMHNSPVLISTGERCELANDDYIPYSDILEHVVLIKENLRK